MVFESYDQFLKRRDVVKIWIPVGQDDQDRQKQALAEARKVAQLNHKNIVQIYTCDQFDDGLIYAIMEFIDGTMTYPRLHRAGAYGWIKTLVKHNV